MKISNGIQRSICLKNDLQNFSKLKQFSRLYEVTLSTVYRKAWITTTKKNVQG